MRDEAFDVARLTTFSVPGSQRFEYWSSVLSQIVTPMSVSSDDPRRFDASIAVGTMDNLTIIDHWGSAHRSHRSQRDVSQSSERSLHLLVSLDCAWNLNHRGKTRMKRGDVVLVDSQYELTLDVPSRHRILNVKFSSPWLETWIPDVQPMVGRKISHSLRPGRALSSFLCQLTADVAREMPLPARVLADHVGALMAIVAGDQTIAAGAQEALHQRICDGVRDCVAQRYMEAKLAACDVAASLDLPEQAVHAALASRGLTFAALLMDVRLNRAAQLLRQAAPDQITLADLASQVGLIDSAPLARLLVRKLRHRPE